MSKPPAAASERFQILSLDGGGVKGLYAAAVLARLEEDLGTRVADHFDLITGTSTGGVIALGLGRGLRPAELVDFYAKEGAAIFRWPRLRQARHVLRAKYSHRRLERALRSMFGERRLIDSEKRLVIPAYNLDTGQVHVFKTRHHRRLNRDWRVPMWEVAMATSAAPTYLPAHILADDRCRLIDGGVWANNPVALGIAEAISLLNVRLEAIQVLSLGTTSTRARHHRRLDRGGVVQWLRGNSIVDVLLRGQSEGVHGLAQHLVGKDDVLRFDIPAPEAFFRLDRADQRSLVALAASTSRNVSPSFSERFADHRAAPFEPVRVDAEP
jgi:patatin-like phospholipase/acyl hydrolase